MTIKPRKGRLYIDGCRVGSVAIRGWHGSWGVGEFKPDVAFAQFAPLFAGWARLMHADAGPISRDNAERLGELECWMYALHPRLWIEQLQQWRVIDILTIDGDLIEWKEGWSNPRDVAGTVGGLVREHGTGGE